MRTVLLIFEDLFLKYDQIDEKRNLKKNYSKNSFEVYFIRKI